MTSHLAMRNVKGGLNWLMLALLLGCNPENDLEIPLYPKYFPLLVGDYRIYQVNEVQITPYNVEAHFNYEIKTTVTDSFKNSEGTYSYIISRYKRIDGGVWNSLDTWLARANDKEIVITENNIPLVRLSFPIQSEKLWNGNAYNNEESVGSCEGTTTSCDLYAYGMTNTPYETENGLAFDNVVEVVENDDPDQFTKHDVRKSFYAFGIGLIYREVSLLNYCTAGDCYGKQLIENGTVLKLELTEYGHE
jgi:hypothetical protein